MPVIPYLVIAKEERGYEALLIEAEPDREPLMMSQPCKSVDEALNQLLEMTAQLVSASLRPRRSPEGRILSLDLRASRRMNLGVKSNAESMDDSK